MSEEILKALMELFALIVKQDSGILINEREYVAGFLNKQLTKEAVDEYLALFDKRTGYAPGVTSVKTHSAPTVKDSVKILNICKKINHTLNQEQKVVVLMRLYELVNASNQFTPQRMNIINTVAEVFRIPSDEFEATEQFVMNDGPGKLKNNSILILDPENTDCELYNRMHAGYTNTKIYILRVASVDLYFMKYISNSQLYLNGLPIKSGIIYTFPKGGSVRSQQGNAIYYSDISSIFLSDIFIQRISFTVQNLSFNFRDGSSALNNISFSIEEGKLVGILGASGSGKTTLINLLSGIEKPSAGTILLNGSDLFGDRGSLEGVFGYVPQDDLLIEDLTIFENLYYAASLCFKQSSGEELTTLVNKTLLNLGLYEKRNFKVGTPLNKVISGGQRKRLNIALELIREPLVMFLDEPTSGLSSRDSENMMDLLRDLTLKGKLIFTVIHQPSSEIFKMFDKVIILDQGGFMAYFGNPVDSVIYFKTLDIQINSKQGECPFCGNVNPETIFNIIETQVVDEFGKYTEKRKITPKEWSDTYNSKHPFTPQPEVLESIHLNLQRPYKIKQFLIYFSRDFRSKIANRQYVLLTLLEAPLLGFILSYIIRYISNPDSDRYIFSENENIPIYIFMSLIVALFLGLTISCEEIYRDRKILKRERFLHLSRTSYLLSKIAILIIIIANPILSIKGMYLHYWLALFSTAFCANMLGLNISASFNSAITIYIAIPLLIIPMMVLSGAMFPFDKLNRNIGNVDKVPLIAEFMPTRWTYEALMVSQFKDNRYSKVEYTKDKETFYMLQKEISQAEFNKIYKIKALRELLGISILEQLPDTLNTNNDGNLTERKQLNLSDNLELIKNELGKMVNTFNVSNFTYLTELSPYSFNQTIADSLYNYLDRLDKLLGKISNSASNKRDSFYKKNVTKLNRLEEDYYNYKLMEILTKPYERKKILFSKNALVQNVDPVFLDPVKRGFPGFRTHFYSPSKYIFGLKTDTFIFNISLLLLSTIFIYLSLYYELPGKAIRFFENFKFRK
jgi:ABC-type multidrug transport system ATPase subunit